MKRLLALSLCLLFARTATAEGPPYKALIIDGQNNHGWQATTPILKKVLEDTKLFTVDVATAPMAPRRPQKPKDAGNAEQQKKFEEALAKFEAERAEYMKAMAQFKPKFSDYKVIISNYNGDRWPRETESAFVEYIEHGGGFVSVHAANNSFPDWPEYNAIIGVGGWGGRNEKSGPYLRLRDGQFARDESKGSGGGHGARHPFLVEVRKADHPITAGLPAKWMHAID